MPIFDTPINSSQDHLEKILAQKLPVLLIFHRNDIDKALEDALLKAAKKHAGALLIVRLDISASAGAYKKYGEPPSPALVALDNKQKVKADAERIRPNDVRAYIAHLLEDAPLPSKAESTKTATSSSSNKPMAVTDQTFRNEVLKSKVPVLVDFWADWCGPCHMIAPHIEQIAKDYAGKVKVVKLDIDKNQVTSQRYQVASIPTMLLFEGGQVAGRVVGANATALKQLVKPFS